MGGLRGVLEQRGTITAAATPAAAATTPAAAAAGVVPPQQDSVSTIRRVLASVVKIKTASGSAPESSTTRPATS
jgi:hypothetical protein